MPQKPYNEVTQPFHDEHDRITWQYYQLAEIDEEEFQELHAANWAAMDKALLDAGYESPVKDLTIQALNDRVIFLEGLTAGLLSRLDELSGQVKT